jgi:serine/threonine protein kinase
VSKYTYLSEVEAIDIILKVINLLELLHSKNIIHSNFNPNEIFLREKSVDKMCFLNLYSCSWDTLNAIGIFLPNEGDNLSIYDVRTRN